MAKKATKKNQTTTQAPTPGGVYFKDVPPMAVALHRLMDRKLALPPTWDMGIPGPEILEPLAQEIGPFEHADIMLSPNARAGKLSAGYVGFLFLHTVPDGELVLTDPLGTETRVKPAKGTLAIAHGFTGYRLEVTPAQFRGVVVLTGFGYGEN